MPRVRCMQRRAPTMPRRRAGTRREWRAGSAPSTHGSRGTHGRAVRVAQAAAEREDVRAPVGAGSRWPRRERADERRAGGAADAAIGEEPVVGERCHHGGSGVAERRASQFAGTSIVEGGSTRSVPPRCAASDGTAAIHTEPPATATADGLLPSRASRPRRRSPGSRGPRSPPRRRPPTRRLRRPRPGQVGAHAHASPTSRSCRDPRATSVPSLRLTTQTAPSPTASALGAFPTRIAAPRRSSAGRCA